MGRIILTIITTLLLVASCSSGSNPGALVEANMVALEQTVDMGSERTDTDDILEFDRAVIDLGEIPLGEIRRVSLGATNRTDKPLVLLDVFTSCNCTKINWAKEPIRGGKKTSLEIFFEAQQMGVFFKKVAVRHSLAGTPVSFAIQGTVTAGRKQ